MRRYVQIAFFSVVVATAGSETHANLVPNWSFEYFNPVLADPPFNSWANLATVRPDAYAIDGWVVSEGEVDYINGYWRGSWGSHSIDLDGGRQGALSLAAPMATLPGATYRLAFDLAGNPDGYPTVKTLEVLVGSHIEQFTFDITGKTHADMGWQTKELFFVADSATTSLTFRSLSSIGNPCGPAIDNVFVDLVSPPPIPAPGAVGLVVVGLGLVGWVKRSLR